MLILRHCAAVVLLMILAIHAQAAESVPGEVVVKLKPGVSVSFSEMSSEFQGLGFETFKTNQNFAVARFSEKTKSERAKFLKTLNNDPRIEYAEPNYIYHSFGSDPQPSAPNDEYFQELWGMQNLRVLPIWNEGHRGSRKIKVAVIDTGIDDTHPDLQANIWVNAGEISANGVDDDANGFIDDIHGWNFVANNNDPRDDQNHGTHCSGTIGGVGNNGLGVAGVNWEVALVPIKFLDANGSGSLVNAVQAIQYATKLGVNVMSNSWGGGGYSRALQDAILEAKNHGILFVAAAGNAASNNESSPAYPASFELDNIIAVAATNRHDALADFSNYSKRIVHVAAPGVDVFSTAKDGKYMKMSGTSMATPHVAGVAALLLSINPSLSYAQIKDLLIKTSDPIRSLKQKTVSGGRVNVYNAVHSIIPAPLEEPNAVLWQDVPLAIESLHPYENSKTYLFPIAVPNAKFIRVIFDHIDTEENYDTISMIDAMGDEVERVSGAHDHYTSEYMMGMQAQLKFKTDLSDVKTGFSISKIQVIY